MNLTESSSQQKIKCRNQEKSIGIGQNLKDRIKENSEPKTRRQEITRREMNESACGDNTKRIRSNRTKEIVCPKQETDFRRKVVTRIRRLNQGKTEDRKGQLGTAERRKQNEYIYINTGGSLHRKKEKKL